MVRSKLIFYVLASRSADSGRVPLTGPFSDFGFSLNGFFAVPELTDKRKCELLRLLMQKLPRVYRGSRNLTMNHRCCRTFPASLLSLCAGSQTATFQVMRCVIFRIKADLFRDVY